MVKFLTAATIGASMLFLAGLTITGTVIALILATPVIVLFSPILVPTGIVAFLAAARFLFSDGCGVTAITLLSWVYGYVTGKHPPGADQLDYARMKIADKARDMKERAKEYGRCYLIKEKLCKVDEFFYVLSSDFIWAVP
ncbi:hypothetical protein Pint_06088 [Pistacia integerrima]|uniref:Uncharacterized protein n=1 Tax=Pistacia integerrima TaxID=434235 RepID=A0ACC0Z6D5_9ROSI|nr:hypothetical protein Pint_06088 [Pistacia integerrima]